MMSCCTARRVFHKPLLVHVVSETWGVGMHMYLRAIGFKHAVLGVSFHHTCSFAVIMMLCSDRCTLLQEDTCGCVVVCGAAV